jgi:hypothetical protein
MLLFTGRYPRTIYDLANGHEPLVLRVVGYATLMMTDAYPPFRAPTPRPAGGLS